MNMNVILNGVNFYFLLMALKGGIRENQIILCNCSVRKINVLDELRSVIPVNF